jgi:hypothetical protein
MLGMLLDASEHSATAFVRESGSLVLAGLRQRRALAVQAGTRRLIADSCCQAVLIWLTLWMVSALNSDAIAGPGQQLVFQQLAAVLACALIGYERIAAIGGLAAIAAFGPLGPRAQLVLLATVLVPIACLLVMVRAPRKRPRDVRRLLWLVPVAVLAALRPHVHVGLPEALAIISIGGVLRLPVDPRPAIACSLVWVTLVSAHIVRPAPAGLRLLMILAALVAGITFALAARRQWLMRHGAPR